MDQETIDRVRRMERCFDALQEAVRTKTAAVCTEPWFRDQLRFFLDYYEGGQWLQDYALDERGELPQELKRGVLSEDAVYHFLEQIDKEECAWT